jgi:hypothetical protein
VSTQVLTFLQSVYIIVNGKQREIGRGRLSLHVADDGSSLDDFRAVVQLWAIRLAMRLLKLKTRWLALIFAVVTVALSMALFYFSLGLNSRTGDLLQALVLVVYAPIGWLALFGTPTTGDNMQFQPAYICTMFIGLALLQWYLIFLAVIAFYRYFLAKVP